MEKIQQNSKIRELELEQIENTFLIMEFYCFSLQFLHKVPFSYCMCSELFHAILYVHVQLFYFLWGAGLNPNKTFNFFSILSFLYSFFLFPLMLLPNPKINKTFQHTAQIWVWCAFTISIANNNIKIQSPLSVCTKP